MKKSLFIFVIGFLFIASCGGIKTSSQGLESVSFLEFIGNPDNYSGGVDVLIDDKTSFKADVAEDNRNKMRGKVYEISTGNQLVTVSYNNKVIYRKQLFMSAQESKKIVLP